MSDKTISKITAKFAKEVAKVKDAFIMEEMKPYYEEKNGDIVWSQKVKLRLAERKDWKMQNEQIRKAIIKDVGDYFAQWGSQYYIIMGSNIEEIINKHFNHDKK